MPSCKYDISHHFWLLTKRYPHDIYLIDYMGLLPPRSVRKTIRLMMLSKSWTCCWCLFMSLSKISIIRNKKYRDRGVRATTSVYHPPLHLSLLLVHHLEVNSTSSPSPSTLTSSSPSLSKLSITDNQRPNEQCHKLSRWAVNYTITITIIILVRLVHHLLLLKLFD